MNCYEFQLLVDEHLDGTAEARVAEDLVAHARACADCATRLARERRLRESLQALPVPDPTPDFAERVLARAAAARPVIGPGSAQSASASRPAWAAACALAASLVIAVVLWFVREPSAVRGEHTVARAQLAAPAVAPPPVAHVAPAAGAQPVRLVFRSATALSNVTIEIALPDGVELDGYPGQRRLIWQSDLRAGSNLLELPVLLHGRGGVLTATLNHGTERRRFAVQVVASPVSNISSTAPLLVPAAAVAS